MCNTKAWKHCTPIIFYWFVCVLLSFCAHNFPAKYEIQEPGENISDCTLYGNNAAPVIETTFKNDYIHILYDLSKQYMYRYFVSKLSGSKAATHIIIWKTIYLLLLRDCGGKIHHLLVRTNFYSSLQKPINHWYDILVREIMTKTCTICEFEIYT